MEQGPLKEHSRSNSQEIPSFMEPETSLLCMQNPITVSYPDPEESSPR
jgi:hypothetical protein